MLLKITCVAVLVVLADVLGIEDNDDESQQEYHDEDSDGHYGGYRQVDSEEFYPVRLKRFKSKPSVKTLSPQEIQEVRGAINQILSGYNQDNPFTPLPSIQAVNEKRSIPDNKIIQLPQNEEASHENYPFYPATKFNDYTDVIDNTKSEAKTYTNELLKSDPDYKTLTITTDNGYDNELIGATINSLSSLPSIPVTDSIITDTKSLNAYGFVTEMDITEKISETVTYKTGTYFGLTGTTYALPITLTDTKDDVKSEIKRILGKKYDSNITSIRLGPNYERDVFRVATNVLPSRSHVPNILLRTPEMTLSQNTEKLLQDIAEEDSKEESPVITPHVDAELLSEDVTTGNSKEVNLGMLPHVYTGALRDNISDRDSEKKEVTIIPPKMMQHSKELDMASFDPGTGPESVTEAASIEEEDFGKDGNEEHPLLYTPNQGDKNYPHATKQHPVGEGQTFAAISHSVIKNKTVSYFTRPTRRTTRRTTRTTTTKFQLDVPALLAIIANLTYDYEMNLTDNLNATLLKYSIPTCETPTTTAKKGVFIDYEANATGTIVAKCFVCGLEVDKIPRQAHCADAFAGDFLPLVPVDMTARGKISKYRKYCRFADVPHYAVNETQPRSVFGRWTGGCSVRWIDLSGVYTQRSCRNRERAIMGRHFASKRMAKLEMALSNIDNGCIVSPMATLVPLSRGISLYARFHACVCTGSWCNAADIDVYWTKGTFLPLLVMYISPNLLI